MSVGVDGNDHLTKVTIDVDAVDLPLLLARAHSDGEPDDQLDIEIHIDGSSDDSEAGSTMPDLVDLVIGAGFDVRRFDSRPDSIGTNISLSGTRLRSLPDYVSSGMRILICGLNPSLHSADLRVGFGRAGNRFWPAALAAGMVSIDRDPINALIGHQVGMTDLVKRATPKAASLAKQEYATGLDRLESLCIWLQPRVVCMVGLAGWQDRLLGGSAVYVMPSTSGLNAGSSLADLTEHLMAASSAASRRVS